MDNWYYVQNGQQVGPVTAEFLRSVIQAGQLGPQDLVWREGMAEWQAIASIPEFAASLGPVRPIVPDSFQPLNYQGRAYQPIDDRNVTAIEWVLCVVCPFVGCIYGIVYLIQGKQRGLKLIGLSLLFTILWSIVRAIVEHA